MTAKQTAGSRKAARKRKPRLSPRFRVVALPQVVGKKIDELTVSNSYDDHGIDIFFEDESGVSFSFEAAIKLAAKQVDTKDNWREIKRWAKPKML